MNKIKPKDSKELLLDYGEILFMAKGLDQHYKPGDYSLINYII